MLTNNHGHEMYQVKILTKNTPLGMFASVYVQVAH